MIKENNRKIEAVVGGIIYDDKKRILLIKNDKWKDVWSIPGGHIEYGENNEQALSREILEETGLIIDNIKLLSVSEGINLSEYHREAHFVFLNYRAHRKDGKEKKSREMKEYKWVKAEDSLKLKISESIIEPIKEFIKWDNKDKEDWEHKYKLALADYQNLIKQNNKDREAFIKYAISDFLQDLLPVYDHLKMSLMNLDEKEKKNPWVQGVGYVLKQFKDLLKSKGIEEIITVGQKFDHHTMEAIEGKGDKVKKELMPGYKLNGRVIRPARVVVK